MMIKNDLLLVAALGSALALFNVGCGGATPAAASPDPAAASTSTSTTSTTSADADGDGVPDNADKCPDKKEDGLPPNPTDGCPKS
jgi:OOP family OmpA-OmpF porin